jgi:hypothetical protein
MMDYKVDIVLLVFLLLFFNNCAMEHTDSDLSKVDHLVFTAPTLEQGLDKIEELLGVRPVPGGRHPEFGTHNALLSLGANTYLEVIAPDPDLPTPSGGLLFEGYFKSPPRLARWVLRNEHIEELVKAARTGGLNLGSVSEGNRETPDGSILSWELTDPSIVPLDGAIPFVISWGNTPHPASAAPIGGALVDLQIEHPEPDKVRESLDLLGVKLAVKKANNARLVAKVETEHGVVELY